MNDITKAPAEDPLSKQAVQVLRDIDELRSNVAWYRQEYEKAQRELALVRRDVTNLHALLDKTEAERNFYQRWSDEIATKLNIVGSLIDEAMVQAKQGAYRPSGAVPNKVALETPLPEAPLPAVVAQGPAIPEGAT